MIVIMAGLPGTGKTTLARALAEHLKGIVISKDVLRAALFEPRFVEYSAEQDDFCQDLMQQAAKYLIRRNPDLLVFFDGRTFSKKYQIDLVRQTAQALQTSWRVIECVCSEESARRRIECDTTHLARNRTYKLYMQVRDFFEAIEEPKLVIDTDAPLEECMKKASQYLYLKDSF